MVDGDKPRRESRSTADGLGRLPKGMERAFEKSLVRVRSVAIDPEPNASAVETRSNSPNAQTT